MDTTAPALRIELFDLGIAFAAAAEARLAGLRSELPSHITVEARSQCDVRTLASALGVRRGIAYVSAAQSLGWMDGGIDAVYSDMFPGIQDKVQARIRRVGLRTAGGRAYLAVGSALTVRLPCGNALVCAPTMFQPCDVSHTRHAYHACVAALAAFLRARSLASAPLTTLALPPLCCGYGGMAPAVSAAQVCDALRDVLAQGRVPPAVRLVDEPLYYVADDRDEVAL